MAVSRFCICERSFWLCETMPLGRCVMRTAESVLLTCCPPAPGRAIGIDAQVVGVDLDLDVVLDLGHDLDQREGRLPTLLRVVGADAHQAVDAALGPQPAVGAATVDGDGRALDARLLALELVEDLGPGSVPLGPAQVHAQQHLGPVGRLGAAGAGADGQQRVALVVRPGEQERRPLTLVVDAQGIRLGVDLRRQGGVGLGQLGDLVEVVGALQQGTPEGQLVAQAVGLTEHALRVLGVVPQVGRPGRRLERVQAIGLRPEVKAAPRSLGSARRARGRRRRPLASPAQVLQEQRPQLDDAQGRLAPCDDGVHAGAVAVVRAGPAVAIAVEPRGIAAGTAIALTGDQVDELVVDGTRLQAIPRSSLALDAALRGARPRGHAERRKGNLRRVSPSIGRRSVDAKGSSPGISKKNATNPASAGRRRPRGRQRPWHFLYLRPLPQ